MNFASAKLIINDSLKIVLTQVFTLTIVNGGFLYYAKFADFILFIMHSRINES